MVSGHGLIQERKIGSDEVIEFEVTGDKIEAIYMLPGYTHNIINLLLVAEVLNRDASTELLSALENAGVTPVVLQGYGLSRLYPESSVRQSADLDIYVGLQNEKKVQEVLRSCGVQVKERAEGAQEASCYYEPVGCIELHAWLMGKDDRAAWLVDNPSGISQPFKFVSLDNGDLYVLWATMTTCSFGRCTL